MNSRNSRTTSVLLAALVLIGGANIAAYAATGGKFILGHTNKAGQSSTLVNTGSGPALRLKTKPGAAPLSVTSSKKVTHLNADRLDGLEGTSLQTRSIVYSFPINPGVVSTAFTATLTGLAPGLYQASYSIYAIMTPSTSSLICLFEYADFTPTIYTIGAKAGGLTTANGAGLLDTRSQTATFRCSTEGGSATLDPEYDQTSQIVLTRIDAVQAVQLNTP